VYAGNLDSTAAPGAANSYKLEDIYNRLGGSALPAQSTFTEPGAAAGTGTGHTLNEVMARIDTRFTNNGDGTVTDNLTRLIWLKNANCATVSPKTWATALTSVAALAHGACGLTDGSAAGDWRVPNVRELYSLIDLSKYGPALPAGHPFTGVQNNWYWTGTTFSGNTSFAWYVYLYYGSVSGGGKTFTNYVWPVRGGQ
jgi:hypothetical protein